MIQKTTVAGVLILSFLTSACPGKPSPSVNKGTRNPREIKLEFEPGDYDTHIAPLLESELEFGPGASETEAHPMRDQEDSR